MVTKDNLKNIGWKDMLPIYLGGTGRMFLITISGIDYLFKPAEKKWTHEKQRFRGIVQEVASKIQKIVDEESYVPCIYFENKELAGSLQIKYKIDTNAPHYQIVQTDDSFDITREETKQFLRDSNGIIRGVDKEQCFRYIATKNDYFNIFINPNEEYGESETIYNYLFKRYINGTLDIDFDILEKYIEKIENISDEDYISIFEEYIDARKHRIETSYLRKLILERKQQVRVKMNDFVSYLKEERDKMVGKKL